MAKPNLQQYSPSIYYVHRETNRNYWLCNHCVIIAILCDSVYYKIQVTKSLREQWTTGGGGDCLRISWYISTPAPTPGCCFLTTLLLFVSHLTTISETFLPWIEPCKPTPAPLLHQSVLCWKYAKFVLKSEHKRHKLFSTEHMCPAELAECCEGFLVVV